MFIKKVSIQGFKTFKNHLVVENLSPNENVIIGSNGSGKSNLFAAIMFVISDEYSNLTNEDRLGLIYQGSGTVMSCFVELEFSTGTTVRRTIGLKKDEFSVDGRVKSKTEVKNVLHSLGFQFGGNNYYMVPQGKITSLTNAKDVERLKLFKEVTGANVFEEKLKKSLRDIQENKVKRERIDSELQELNGRLTDLNEENAQLVQCQRLEKEKKLLQYSIFERYLAELNELGNSLKNEYDESIFESQDLMQQLEDSEGIVNKYKSKLKSLKSELKVRNALDTNELSNIQVEISDLDEKKRLLESRIAQISQRKAEMDATKADLSKKIEENNLKIESLQPDYNSYTLQQQKIQANIDSSRQRQNHLITKQGRYSKFVSQEEKDTWVKEQIVFVEKEKEQLYESINNLKIESTKDEISTLIKSIEEANAKLNEELAPEKESLDEELSILQDEYYEIVDKRTDSWRKEQADKSLKESYEQELEALNRKLNASIDRPTAFGLSNLPLIVRDLNLTSDQVIGKVGDLIQFSDKYKQCIETTAGNSLFNVIVDTDETASKIIAEMSSKKLGRITFMPLNRIAPGVEQSYPDASEGEFIPLIKKVKFDKKISQCMNLLFGRTVVVKELSTGVILAKKHGLTAVTPDGDKVDGRGALTGGFNDIFDKNGIKSSTNRLDCILELKNKKKEIDELEAALVDLHKELEAFDSEAETMNNQIQDITLQKLAIQEQEASIKKDQLQRNSEISTLESQLVQLNESAANFRNSIMSLDVEIDILKKDLEQPFDQQLSSEETTELENLTLKLQNDTADLEKLDQEFTEKEMAIEVTRHEVQFNLKPQLNQLLEQILGDEQNVLAYNKKVAALNKKLRSKKEKEAKITNDIEESHKEVASLLKEKNTNDELLKELYDEQKETLDKLEGLQTNSERIMAKIVKNNDKRDSLTNKIVELGFISEESLSKFSKLSEEKLVEKLKDVTVELSKFSNVNKRAGESFARFLTKKEELEKKADELRESEKSIDTLITSLKDQKVQAIESTFQKVALFFEQIFNQIVPKGKGQLIIKKKLGSSKSVLLEGDVDDIYDGVAIQVSFNSKDNEQLFVDQLSGGQKTVCAIALILAIQKVEPAPLYMFDELDAALDKEFRSSVANVIHSLSHQGNSEKSSQFISTTFRRELLNDADKYFRVRFENKNSVVEEVSRMDAIQFVRGEKRQRIAEV